MELEGTNRLKKTAQVQSATGRTERGRNASPLQKTSRADRLTLSRQALTYLEEQSREVEERTRQESEKSSEEALLDLLDKSNKTMKKCQQIAARIMAGDKVPPEDLNYLMKNDMEGYRLAMAMRKTKKNPKEWESVLDEEDRRSADAAGDELSGSVPATPAAGGESGALE